MSLGSVERALFEAVSLLAMPARDALASLPANGARPDEMSRRFDESYTAFVEALVSLPPQSAFEALQDLDDVLNKLSHPSNRALWAEDEFRTHAVWDAVRERARVVLIEFGWVRAGFDVLD